MKDDELSFLKQQELERLEKSNLKVIAQEKLLEQAIEDRGFARGRVSMLQELEKTVQTQQE